MTNTGGTPAGWYHAPGDPEGTQRYWDGTQWVGEPQAVQDPAQPPSGAAQPPAGGYAPPAGGQAPGASAAPPGYAAYGAGGGPGAYGAAQGRYTIGDAFNYGWTKFQQNIGSIILGSLAVLGVIIVSYIIFFFVLGGIATVGGDSEGGAFALLISMAIFLVLIFLLSLIVQAGIVRVALDITYGRQVEVKRIFSTDQLGQILIASLLVSVMTGIGYVLCVFPSLIVAFFTQFTFPFLIDKQLPAVEAIKRSANLVNQNLGTLIGFYLASVVAYFVGMVACGIGLLVAAPVVLIATVYTYRTMQGEAVAA